MQRNFRSDNREILPLRDEDAAKHEESDMQWCCGVPWYPSSRTPFDVYSNNRCKISLTSRRRRRRRRHRHHHRRRNSNSIVAEGSRNLASATRTTPSVSRCSCTRSHQSVSFLPAAALINCFGKGENKHSTSRRSSTAAVCDRCQSPRPSRHSQRNAQFESNALSLNSDAIRGCRDDRSLISCGEIRSGESTLDRFQKFKFGGDRTARSSAGRRGSVSSHKKKSQRNSDKKVNLKKLTGKLKQQPSAARADTAIASSDDAPIPLSDGAAVSPTKLTQIVIPLRHEEPAKDKDDIFQDVNLKLTKPQSRTIIGSYYQRSIPFRSASFSQVFYSPGDRKYVRNSLRKQNSNKRIATGTENSSATLPRVGSSSVQLVEESGQENEQRELLNVFPIKSTENAEEQVTSDGDGPDIGVFFPMESIEKVEERAASDGDQPRDTYAVKLTAREEERAASDGDCPKRNDDEQVSLLALEPSQAVTSSVIPIMAPDSCNTFPQPPKRNKHKHKHRHRYFGRLYFSDENIFTPNQTESLSIDNPDEQKPAECETISVTITTPPNSDSTSSNNETESCTVEMNLVEEQKKTENTGEPSANSIPSVDEAPKVQEESVESARFSPKEEAVHEDNSGWQTNQTNPSSPEDTLKPYWPLPAPSRERKLTPQTSIERDDEPECVHSRRYHLFTRGDSFSEAESDQGDKRSISPASKEGRLSPSPYTYDLLDLESRKSRHSPVPYSKRPVRGPYLEMIVNEQKKPEKTKNTFRNLQIFDSQFPPSQTLVHDRAVDDYYLRRSNTSPHPIKLDAAAMPRRKVSANIPFSSPSSLRSTSDEKTVIHHQRTTSSPSQLMEFSAEERCSDAAPPVPSQQLLQQLLRGSSERSLIQDIYPKASSYKDTRSHIVVELYDTERSYVESLQILVTKYLQPLKSRECNNGIEPYVVEEIFYKIPEILSYHEIFLEELRIRLEGWNTSKCIGDIFLDTFTKPAVIEAYVAFIMNWKTARESIKHTCHMKPAFARFLEAMAREHKGKLALDSLLIMPVQRIPRYELLIQALLKHTEVCHPDYDKLQEALRQVRDLAMRINCSERENLELEQIESMIDGLGNLVATDRVFLRYDLVMMTSGQGLSRKERALFLFNDLLLITSIKRRSSTVKKPILSSPNALGKPITNLLESNKYKLLSKIPLEYLDIEKVKDEHVKKALREMEHLTEDVHTLSQMVDLVTTLHCARGQIEDNLRDMLSAVNKQLTEKHVNESQLSHLELTLNTRNNIENISVIFSNPEKRTNWEETFLEAKARLNVGGDRRLSPEFLTSVPVRKTRAGLTFTCAASYMQERFKPSDNRTILSGDISPDDDLTIKDAFVWICNSDGYVGQVCILSLTPEPAVTSCNGVCNARISSITCVPYLPQSTCSEKYQDTAKVLKSANSINSVKNEQLNEATESIPVENSEHDSVPDINLNSSSSSDDEDQEDVEANQKDKEKSLGETSAAMWLGTEDGVVHVYNCADTNSLRVKRNRLKIQHNFAINHILYVDKSVFVSLANGEVYVYYWSPDGWNTNEPTILRIGCVTTPVSRMFLACGKLWCICHNVIKILNTHTLHVETSFSVLCENNRAITSVAVFGFGVYLSLQNSAVLRLIHGSTYDILAEINVAPAVTKMLSGTDDIIRQHKAACLRVTALQVSDKEQLWIGTSAGVILTMPLPTIKESTTKITSVLHPVGLPQGHTGHVRFLTLVKCRTKSKAENGRRLMKTPEKNTDVNRVLIISGGDGYEDFRSSSVSEIAGREDSTNHLLIWRL